MKRMKTERICFVPIEDENLLNEVYEEYVRMAEEEDECGCGLRLPRGRLRTCEAEENQDACRCRDGANADCSGN